MSAREAYPRRAEHNTVAEGGNRGRGPRLRADPLGLSNWLTAQKTAFEMRDKTGSDVHIAASTIARRVETGKIRAVPVPDRHQGLLSQPVWGEVRRHPAPLG